MTRTRVRAPAAVRVVCDGQSLMRSPDVAAKLMAGRGVPWINVAVSGNGWLERTNTFDLGRQARAGTDILVLFGGQGDIFDPPEEGGGQTGATTYTRMVTYKNLAITAGFDVVIAGSMPAVGPNSLGGGRPTVDEAQAIADFNTLVMANSGGFDHTVDCHTGVLADATNTVYFAVDRLHLTDAGAAEVAARFGPALEAAL